MNENFQDWLCRVREAKRLALISHISPDGDTVGSTLALRLAFLSLGKEVDVVCDGEIPEHIAFLEGADKYIKPEQATGHYDTVISIDGSDRSRMGAAEYLFDAADVRLVIDHHATNLDYGDVNFVRRGESATCLLAYEAIRALGVEITTDMATALLLGMSTDTGHFQYPATSPETLIAAGELMRRGANISLLTRRLYRTQPLSRVHLARVVYNKMSFALDGRVGVVKITKEDFAETGTTPDQADGMVNHALEIEGVRMAVLASERDDGVKMSLRAIEPDDVSGVAFSFGGGGHAQASGCLIDKPMDEAVDMILDAMKKAMGLDQ